MISLVTGGSGRYKCIRVTRLIHYGNIQDMYHAVNLGHKAADMGIYFQELESGIAV